MEIHVKKNIAYESPVTGKLITTRDARKEDLKRHQCIEYDTEMKTDYARRIEEGNRTLEQKVDADLDAAIAKMSGRERTRLFHELDAGAEVGYVRKTR